MNPFYAALGGFFVGGACAVVAIVGVFWFHAPLRRVPRR